MDCTGSGVLALALLACLLFFSMRADLIYSPFSYLSCLLSSGR